MFSLLEDLEAALEELRQLGTTWARGPRDDERFVELYLQLQEYYQSQGQPDEFERFCRARIAVAQHDFVKKTIKGLLRLVVAMRWHENRVTAEEGYPEEALAVA